MHLVLPGWQTCLKSHTVVVGSAPTPLYTSNCVSNGAVLMSLLHHKLLVLGTDRLQKAGFCVALLETLHSLSLWMNWILCHIEKT